MTVLVCCDKVGLMEDDPFLQMARELYRDHELYAGQLQRAKDQIEETEDRIMNLRAQGRKYNITRDIRKAEGLGVDLTFTYQRREQTKQRYEENLQQSTNFFLGNMERFHRYGLAIAESLHIEVEFSGENAFGVDPATQ